MPKKMLWMASMVFCAVLAGCASSDSRQHVGPDGRTYIGDAPVIATGKLLRIEATGKDGAVHNVINGAASAVGDLVGDAGIAGGLSDMGAFPAGGGIVIGLVAGFVGSIAKDMAPPPPMIFVENADSVELQFPTKFSFLRDELVRRCVYEGGVVQIVQVGPDRFELYSISPELVRLSSSPETCDAKLKRIAADSVGTKEKSSVFKRPVTVLDEMPRS